MAPTISYADPAVGAVLVSFEIPDVDRERIVRDATARRDGYRDRLRKYAWRRMPSLLTHEWAHVLQVARYPLLHVRAARQVRLVGDRVLSTRRGDGPVELPVHWSIEERWRWGTLFEASFVKITVDEDGVSTRAVEPGALVRGGLRELDLVEEDATIFEYRVEIGSRGTGAGYRRWLLERAHYRALFYFLADLTSDDDAINLIPVITRAAFATTRPMASLAAIVADLVHAGPGVLTSAFPDEDWDVWAEGFFLRRLRERFGDADEAATDFHVPALSDHQGVISPDRFRAMVERTPYLAASQLAMWSAQDGDLLPSVMRTPWRYIWRRGEGWDERLDRYQPPVITYRVRSASGVESTLIDASDAMREAVAPFDGDEAVKMSVLLAEILRAKQLLDVGLGLRAPLAVCPHTACRFHGSGLCDGWLSIPAEDPDECDFPNWLAVTSGRTVTADGRLLIDITGSDNG